MNSSNVYETPHASRRQRTYTPPFVVPVSPLISESEGDDGNIHNHNIETASAAAPTIRFALHNDNRIEGPIDDPVTPNMAWNPNIDWSRSTNDLSSDEESLPNSVSSAELSYMSTIDDENFLSLETDSTDEFRRQSQWEIEHTNHPRGVIPPFRRRAHTLDGAITSPLRRQHLIQQERQQRTRSGDAGVHVSPATEPNRLQNMPHTQSAPLSISSSLMHDPRGRMKRVTFASRGLMVLFLIATYTTFWLPYPNYSLEVQSVLEKQRDNLIADDITSPSETLSAEASSSVVAIEDDVTSSKHRFELPASPAQRVATRVVGATFARKRGLKKFRREEVANYLQQNAIVQERDSWWWVVPWHFHVGVLAIVAIWAFLIDYSRRQRALISTTIGNNSSRLIPVNDDYV